MNTKANFFMNDNLSLLHLLTIFHLSTKHVEKVSKYTTICKGYKSDLSYVM